MSAHTPGPWVPVIDGDWSVEPDDAEDSGACTWQQIAANGKTVAIAVDGNPGWGVETTLLNANVRLIAAAPDLLEALRNFVSALAEDDEDGLTELADEMIIARAAIAKATGAA